LTENKVNQCILTSHIIRLQTVTSGSRVRKSKHIVLHDSWVGKLMLKLTKMLDPAQRWGPLSANIYKYFYKSY